MDYIHSNGSIESYLLAMKKIIEESLPLKWAWQNPLEHATDTDADTGLATDADTGLATDKNTDMDRGSIFVDFID